MNDIIEYLDSLRKGWSVIAGLGVVWFLTELVPKLFGPLRWKPPERWELPIKRLRWVWVGCILIAAPFPAWRDERNAQVGLRKDLNLVEMSRDSCARLVDELSERQARSTKAYVREQRALALIARAVTECDAMLSASYMMTITVNSDSIARWSSKLAAHIQRDLGEEYAAEFRGAAREDEDRSWSGGGNLGLQRRKSVLVKILQELRVRKGEPQVAGDE